MATTMPFTLKPLSDALGVEVLELDLRLALDPREAEALYRAWLAHGLLLFRGQSLSADEQVRVGALFGQVERNRTPEEGAPGAARIRYVANRSVAGKAGILPDGAMLHHSDWCYRDRPYKAGLLFAQQVPESGGETVFASAERAYATLSPDLKARIAGLRAVQAYAYQETERPATFDPEAQRAEHPVVVGHPETGRSLLFVNRLMTERIVGLAREESEALLAELFDHLEQPAFAYVHRWRRGDLLVWDNLATQHGRRDFDPGVPRILRRITIRGERPGAAVQAAGSA
ncbi:MAG: TauD/TfdA family dioxygenase [Kiloniellales bacterium]|nr:TauD/TfdA family dioxygenase [Kiloniellales bacterium]